MVINITNNFHSKNIYKFYKMLIKTTKNYH